MPQRAWLSPQSSARLPPRWHHLKSHRLRRPLYLVISTSSCAHLFVGILPSLLLKTWAPMLRSLHPVRSPSRCKTTTGLSPRARVPLVRLVCHVSNTRRHRRVLQFVLFTPSPSDVIPAEKLTSHRTSRRGPTPQSGARSRLSIQSFVVSASDFVFVRMRGGRVLPHRSPRI